MHKKSERQSVKPAYQYFSLKSKQGETGYGSNQGYFFKYGQTPPIYKVVSLKNTAQGEACGSPPQGFLFNFGWRPLTYEGVSHKNTIQGEVGVGRPRVTFLIIRNKVTI